MSPFLWFGHTGGRNRVCFCLENQSSPPRQIMRVVNQLPWVFPDCGKSSQQNQVVSPSCWTKHRLQQVTVPRIVVPQPVQLKQQVNQFSRSTKLWWTAINFSSYLTSQSGTVDCASKFSSLTSCNLSQYCPTPLRGLLHIICHATFNIRDIPPSLLQLVQACCASIQLALHSCAQHCLHTCFLPPQLWTFS